MTTPGRRGLMIEYWFRKLLSMEVSIDDIINIINEFAKEFEIFDKDLTAAALTVNDKYTIISNTGSYFRSSFGANIASMGKKYHWRVKIEKNHGYSPNMNIGIIEANKAGKHVDKSWWGEKYAYSYFKSGNSIRCTSYMKE